MATVSLTVRPVNDAPVAIVPGRVTDEDTPVAITLTGTDVDGDSLTYTVVQAPSHGTLSGTAPNVTYTPAADYHGPDSFTFQVNDGQAALDVATVSLTVRSVNDAPEAVAQSAATDEDTSVALTLVGTDVEGDGLTYTVVQAPAHGTLSGTAPNLTYTPAADYHGPDSFTFSVSDGQATSAPATVSLSVASVSDAPEALAQTLSVGQRSTHLTLVATDAEGDALSYRIESPPSEGVLSGTPPEMSYTPPPDFRGTVSFSFSASDGQATSTPATITLHVSNEAPQVALSASTFKPLEGEGVLFTSMAEDPGGDTLSFSWDFGDGSTSEERHPSHTYVNEGRYEVVLTVSDGVESGQAAVLLDVLNTAPVLVPLDLPASGEESKPITFQAFASDSGAADTLSFSWDFGDGSPGVHGPQVTHAYADDGDYTVTVTVRDDAQAATQASRPVRVSNLPPLPEPLEPQSIQAGQELRVQLRASDVAGAEDPLSWTLVEGPGSLTPEGQYSWTPPRGSAGEFVVRARVADDEGGSSELLFRITVSNVTISRPRERLRLYQHGRVGFLRRVPARRARRALAPVPRGHLPGKAPVRGRAAAGRVPAEWLPEVRVEAGRLEQGCRRRGPRRAGVPFPGAGARHGGGWLPLGSIRLAGQRLPAALGRPGAQRRAGSHRPVGWLSAPLHLRGGGHHPRL